QSPEYVPESDFEAHPEDDNDEDPEEDPVDYLADGGDDGDDEEGSSEDDEDDDIDIEADEEEEEEHPAPTNSVVVASTAADQAPSAKETEPFETEESAATPPPHPAYRMTARISIPAPIPMPAWPDLEIVRLLAMSSPPALPLSPWEDRPEVTLPPQKRLGIALGPRYEVGESSSAAARPAGDLRADYGFVATMDREIMRDPEREVGYGITDSWDEIVETLQGAPARYMREFETRVRQDTDEIYMRLDDEQTERQLLAGRLNMLFRDRRAHGQQGLAGGPTQPELPEEADQETVNTTTVTNAQLQEMINQGVTAALAARDALRSTNGDDSHNSRIGVRRTERATRECTYIDFLKCQPSPFKGTEGVASLSQWCERMESVFHISNYTVENQVKFATCTLHSVALTWWNTHVQTIGHEAAYGMSWKTLMKMMTKKYYPRNEIKKLEIEL
nr:hypothetical protein [Tanacetum cinerariifolium]